LKHSLAALCAASLALLAGCGGSSGGSALNGNYALQTTPTGSASGGGGGYFLGGMLSGSGSVKGTFHVLDSSNCIPSTSPVPVTGSVSGSSLHLTTTAVQSQVFDIKATISSDGSTITGGTYQVSGACSASNLGGSLTGFLVQPFTGSYTGTLTVADIAGNPTSTQFATTANLTQSSSPDTNGYFTVTGPITINSPCFANFAIAQNQIFGTQILIVATPNGVAPGAGVPTLNISAFATDSTTKQISGRYNVANMTAGCTTNGYVLITHP